MEIVFHNSFLISIKHLRGVSRSTPAGSESRKELGTDPAWKSTAACLPKADRRFCNPFLQALPAGFIFGM